MAENLFTAMNCPSGPFRPECLLPNPSSGCVRGLTLRYWEEAFLALHLSRLILMRIRTPVLHLWNIDLATCRLNLLLSRQFAPRLWKGGAQAAEGGVSALAA